MVTTMLDRTWKTIEKVPVQDMRALFVDLISVPGKEIHIGSDSQQAGRDTHFVTVLVVLTPGRGGRAFYCSEQTPRIKSLRERLLKEVWLSVSLGLEASPLIGEQRMTIHVDANPDLSFKSSAYIQELTGMVVSQGFDLLLKPDAWCAQHVADHGVKHKVLNL